MVRLIGFFAGLVFCFVLFIAAVQPREAPTPVAHGEEPERVAWSFDGPAGLGVFGSFDNGQLQRGFQVYKEVCSACHSLSLLSFRDLQQIGFSEAEVKAIALGYEVPSINQETGEAATRPGLPADRFPPAFPNEVAARAANNNALPPDFSVIAKAREGGADYLYSLVGLGYVDPPAGHEVPEGLNYNKYFSNLNIAMAAPLSEDAVTYNDGTKASVDQMARDVSAFLVWTAEPKTMARRQTGLGVVIFLTIMSVFAYLTYRKVWADLKTKPPTPQPA